MSHKFVELRPGHFHDSVQDSGQYLDEISQYSVSYCFPVDSLLSKHGLLTEKVVSLGYTETSCNKQGQNVQSSMIDINLILLETTLPGQSLLLTSRA